MKTLLPVRAELEKIAKQHNPLVAIDFRGVSTVDSSATGLLLNCAREIQKRLGCFAFFNASADLRQIFEVVGLCDIVPIYDTRKAFEEIAGST